MVQSKVSHEVQVAAFIKHKDELFDVNGEVKPCSHEVFKALVEQLGMSAAAVRLSVVRNANSIWKSTNKKPTDPSKESAEELISDNDCSFINQSIESVRDESIPNENIRNESVNDVSHNTNQSAEINSTRDDTLSDQDIVVGKKTISIVISVEQRDIFGALEHKRQGKKMRIKAAVGWGGKLRDIIWEHFKSQCCWVFKSADPNVGGGIICTTDAPHALRR